MIGAMHDDQPGPSREPERSAVDRRWIGRLIVGLSLVVIFLLFISGNSQPVNIDFVFFNTDVPLIWVFLLCALIGGLIAYLLARPGRQAQRRYIKELERQARERRDDR